MNQLTTQPQLLDQLTQTVQECFESNRPFSAYNITIMTRDREKIRLRHQDIIGEIHKIDVVEDVLDYGFTNSDGNTYSWARSEFNNWNGPAFQVYHPVGYDVNNFVPEGVQPASSTEVQASIRPVGLIGLVTPQADGTQPDAGGAQNDGTFKTDYRNRLLVPTKFLKEAGIQAGDVVNVLADNIAHTVVLYKESNIIKDASLRVTVQLVEKNGDIRISSTTLKSAELNDNKFVIETGEKDAIDAGCISKIKVVQIKTV